MTLPTEPYPDQVKAWPPAGRHILAHFDADTVVVYQAYRPSIGRYAAEHGRLGGPDFSYSRMSWVKPNFLWMMYRSGWGTKENQEVTLALRIRRSFFDFLLAEAVPSTWDPDQFAAEDWQAAVARSAVRVQWDPDRHPTGAKLDRRAIQLGLRGDGLAAFGTDQLLEVVDLSAFVAEQRAVLASAGVASLMTPRERVYLPADPAVRRKLRLDSADRGRV